MRDVLFLVSGIPDFLRIGDLSYFVYRLAERELEQIGGLVDRFPDLSPFMKAGEQDMLSCIGCRGDWEDDDAAVRGATEMAQRLLDGYSTFDLLHQPELAEVCFLRKECSDDLWIWTHRTNRWLWGHPTGEDVTQLLRDTNRSLSDRLLPFFETLLPEDEQEPTEIINQLRCSCRMFRLGSESHSFGLEFLAKFSALEGLLCGPAKANKRRIMATRASDLFHPSRPEAEVEINDLWQYRCVASHRAFVFYDEDIPGTRPLQLEMEKLEKLYLGALAFVIENREFTGSYDRLWQGARDFVIPAEFTRIRPAGVGKFAADSWIDKHHLEWTAVGRCFDDIFARQAELIQQAGGDPEEK